MQENQNIKVFIAGRPYTLSVVREEEEVVRKAVEVINDTVTSYSKSYEYKDHQDLFAMVALQHVANSIRLQEQKSFMDNKLENKLSQIDQLLSEHLEIEKV
jgi:cell division protein ZapA (FtsZ GTPase activity inhibitor)